MRNLVLLLSVVTLCLSGCASQPAAVADPHQYPAEVVQKEVSTCETTCKATAEQEIMSSGAPNKEELFEKNKPKLEVFCAKTCQCTFDRVQKKVTFEDFRGFEKDMATRSKAPDPAVKDAILQASQVCAEESKPLITGK
jgi:hypothetical protein